jgi:hypothetical protein
MMARPAAPTNLQRTSIVPQEFRRPKRKLDNLTLDPYQIHFFMADAISMYTSIDTDHALEKYSSSYASPPLLHVSMLKQ